MSGIDEMYGENEVTGDKIVGVMIIKKGAAFEISREGKDREINLLLLGFILVVCVFSICRFLSLVNELTEIVL